MSGAPTDPARCSSPFLAISNHVVQLMSEYTGRGPTKARTTISDGLVTVVLAYTLTKGERSPRWRDTSRA